jgi:competence protein ComEC
MKFNLKNLILAFTILAFIFLVYTSESLKPTETFQATFFDVGQGDAMLFQTPKNIKILIDGGRDNKIINELGKYLSWLDRDIDIVIATHDDADHIFGLVQVLEKYNVKILFVSLPNSSNPIMQKVIDTAKDRNIKIITVEKPGQIETEDGVTLKFLFPTTNQDMVEDGNNASIVTQIIYQDKKILSTGDLGILGEKYLVNLYGNELKSNILKLGHHGSNTSTSAEFLQKVRPEVAIVSAGRQNQFGHPHESVISLVKNFGIQIRQTQTEGNIHFEF